MPRLARSLLGCLGFSCQSVTAIGVVQRQDAEAVSPRPGAPADRDGHVGPLAPVLLDERPVVHLVDVVAGEDEDRVRAATPGWSGCSGARRRPCPGTTPRRRLRAMYGCIMRTPPEERSRSQGRPAPMWSLSDRGLYWVSTTTSLMSELTQLLSVKSMIRYLPANGTAGLARTPDRIDRRSPSPPARTIAVTASRVDPTHRRARCTRWPRSLCGRRPTGR